MPIPVVNPLDGDDLHASSITINVTDKIVAWAASHETGALTNGALRHTSDNIDDAALPESTVYAVTMNQHGRNDTFASGISALAGGSASGYAARLAALGALPYRNIQAINTELATNAVATAGASQLVRRRADGSADFAATSSFATIVASGTITATGNITGNNIDANGLLFAGSGNVQITTALGNLDATKLSGAVPTTSMPALTGDVTTIAGAVATTVVSTGGKTAAAIATSVNATTAASGTAVANHGNLAKYDASGGMTFDGPVVGTQFTATAFVGTATAVPASGIVGTVVASQIDSAIARVANVPTNAGTGATGVWPISISGSAAAIAAGGVTTTSILDRAVTGAKLADASITPEKLVEGYVAQEGAGTTRVFVNSLHRWNQARAGVYWPGGYVDLATNIAGLTPGQSKYVLIEINSTPAAFAIDGAPVTGALADVNRPLKDPDTTGLAFVAITYGQTAILQANISQFKGTDGGDTSGSGSQVGHIHGQGSESRVGAIGLDQGFAHPTPTASLSFLIEPKQYLSTAGVSATKGQTTVGPIANPSSGLRIIPVYLDPASGSYLMGTPSDDPTAPAKPAFTGNQDGICYIHTQAGATVIKAGPDGINAWIEDARTWTKGGLGVSSLPVGVSDGGTGQSTFAQGLIWQSNASVGTTPLTTVPASNSATVGLAIKPAPTGMSAASTVYDIELGGGTIANGSTALARIVGAHVVAPIKSGAGATTDAIGVLIDAPASGASNNFSLVTNGPAVIGPGTLYGVGSGANNADLTVYGSRSIASVNAQLAVADTADSNRRLNLGYDAGQEKGYIQGIRNGTGYEPLHLQPGGSSVMIGGVAGFPANPLTNHCTYRNDTCCWYRWTGTTWAVMGVEQTFVLNLGNVQTINSTTAADLPSSVFSVTTRGAATFIMNGSVRLAVASGSGIVQGSVNGSSAGQTITSVATDHTEPVNGRWTVAAAGTYTVKLTAQMAAVSTSMTIFQFNIVVEVVGG